MITKDTTHENLYYVYKTPIAKIAAGHFWHTGCGLLPFESCPMDGRDIVCFETSYEAVNYILDITPADRSNLCCKGINYKVYPAKK